MKKWVPITERYAIIIWTIFLGWLIAPFNYDSQIKSIPLTLNESISYSKTKGFILDNLPNPVGQYRCEISKEDYVTVKVKPTNGTLE